MKNQRFLGRCGPLTQRDYKFLLIGFIAAFLMLFAYSSFVIKHTNFSTVKPLDPLNVNTKNTRDTLPANSHSSSSSSSSSSSKTITSSSSSSINPTSAFPDLGNITVVTGFVDIGVFGKGRPDNKRDWHIYEQWASAYSLLKAPVVMYTNSDAFARFFLHVRRRWPPELTRVVQVNLTTVWAFSLKPQIASIYRSGYPKHWPNTVYPEYTCVTHSKFDFLLDALDHRYFPSPLIAWMDVGYLRNVAGEVNSSIIYVTRTPPKFDPRRVFCGEVFTANFGTPWRNILRHNVNWVAGGFFLATRDVMRTFVEQYRRAVTSFLKLGESQVEQHIIYATYTKEGRKIVNPTVELQAPHGGWFSSGFACLKRINVTSPVTSSA